MNRLLNHPLHAWLSLPLRVYLGAVFVYASLYKIQVPAEFALNIATYQILPLNLINLSALAMPWVEVVAGTLLVLGLFSREAALICGALLVVFIAAIASALYFDLRLSCGCFASGDAAHEISLATIWRDVGWLAIALYTTLVPSGKLGLDGLLARRRAKELTP